MELLEGAGLGGGGAATTVDVVVLAALRPTSFWLVERRLAKPTPARTTATVAKAIVRCCRVPSLTLDTSQSRRR